ncbi:MAG TPA: glucose-6-phosphate dehydrogenase assembly protein OpcA [Actinomycetales bacterium]|nr:glucose-6-phosphate dehydrogenase assembly protein OpcA [Actinomycetales bacterium]
MIIDLPSITSAALNRKLVDLRDTGGAIALGRVLTLVIVTDEHHAEEAIEAANLASREHPCRVVVIAQANRRGADRMDAQIRVGGDAGASEVIVLRLYGKLAAHGDSVVTPLLLADSPVVVWWPEEAPLAPSEDPVGAMGQRRITDAAEAKSPRRELDRRREHYAPGDTDLAWTRTTKWRGLLAAALDQPPYEPVTQVTVTGASDSPSTDLLAAWLSESLRCPVVRARMPAGSGIFGVRLQRKSGPIDLIRADGTVATLSQPGQPDRRISLPRRSLTECLTEELRRLDPDEVYAATLELGLPRLPASRTVSASTAAERGAAPSPADSRRRAARASEHERQTADAIQKASPDDSTKAAGARSPAKSTRRPAKKAPQRSRSSS